jgi:hypothetical protein
MEYQHALSRLHEIFNDSLQAGTAALFGPGGWLGAYLVGFLLGIVFSKGTMDRYDTVSGMYRFINWTFIRVGMWLFLFGMPMGFLAVKLGFIPEPVPPDFIPISLILGAFLFGSAQAITGYCPGIGLASLGRGALDVLVWLLGIIVGNIFFAQVIYGSDFYNFAQSVNLGKVTFSKLLFGLGLTNSWFEFPFIIGFMVMFVVMITVMAFFDGFIRWFDKSFSHVSTKVKNRKN